MRFCYKASLEKAALDGRSSVRAGYGMFYVLLTPSVYRTAGARTEPFYRNVTIQNPVGFPSIDQVIANELARGTAISQPWVLQYEANTGYEQKFNVSVEREILSETVLRAAYVGGRGVHILRYYQGNQPPAQLVGARWVVAPGAPRVNPAFGLITTMRSDAQTFYNALQLRMDRRPSRGLLLRASYTLSKNIDDSGVDVAATDFAQNQGATQNPLLTKGDRALSPTDARHGFNVSWVYSLPTAGLGGVGKKMFGDWQLNGIVTLSSGTPFTATLNYDHAPTGSGGQRPDLAPARSNNPINAGNPDRYYDLDAFILPPPNSYGNLGRNTLIGPGFAAVDLGVTKNTAIRSLSEDFTIQFRAEFFNALNRASFSRPATDVLSRGGIRLPDAGKITRTVGTEREIQLGLKIIW